MREVISNILVSNKIKIAGEAENGKVAVEKYKELMPELVIMDIDMPQMDGMEALKAIKEFDPSAKVVMCSQVSKQSTVDEAIRLGALNFIAKPFKADRVLSIVKQILGLK
ncbi:MAG: response regulator [Oscillospiraceae bacterium]|nr:response regulator [Oscillospiraceae bacterium]